MTLLQNVYESDARQQGYQQGYEEGYTQGHLAARLSGISTARSSIMDAMKEDYEIKIAKARRRGIKEGRAQGYNTGWKEGRADGIEEGRAHGRKERIEILMMPSNDDINLAWHLRPLLDQVKEGSPIAVAIAERIETAITEYLNSKP